ncbi:MAG: TIGR03089 family protein, partial [Actinomycetia bacterium]|nr:TIGR03089 family protein [Actinomycetes bacterium]
RSVDDVLAAARASAASQELTAADRLMSTATWDTSEHLIDHLLAVYVAGASLVQVANPDPTLLDRRRDSEKLTRS